MHHCDLQVHGSNLVHRRLVSLRCMCEGRHEQSGRKAFWAFTVGLHRGSSPSTVADEARDISEKIHHTLPAQYREPLESRLSLSAFWDPTNQISHHHPGFSGLLVDYELSSDREQFVFPVDSFCRVSRIYGSYHIV
nr:hypothetical protein CFP56_63353 [Quercus suber]